MRKRRETQEEETVEEIVSVTLVQIVRRKSGYVLVQWDNGVTLQRAWVAADKFDRRVDVGDKVEVERVEEWPPFGERWDLLFELAQVTPEVLDRELKRKNIWTIEDLQLNPNVARGVLSKIYGLDIVKMLNTAASKQQATGG